MYEELTSRLLSLSEIDAIQQEPGICRITMECIAEIKEIAIEAADAIVELNKRIDFLMNCIYESEDALDRGADNEWARAALEKAERGQDDV